MVYEKIRQMISEQLDIDIDRIDDNTNIIEDLGADSLDIVELMMAAEEEFAVMVAEEEIKNLKTVGDVVKYIEDNM